MLADIQSARSQTVALAQASSSVQWAPAIISTIVLGTFGFVMWAALTRALPAGSETILNMLLGTLAAMATSAVAYWLGSSSGSAEKTRMLYNSTPTPPPN
jgi:zinc transporter ZupT